MRKLTLTLAILGSTALTGPVFAQEEMKIVDEPL